MKPAPTFGSALKALSVAAAMCCGAGAALAADATVSITSFSASAAEFSGYYVIALDAYQNYALNALQGGGLFGASSDNFTADNWNLGLNRLAQTANAKATGNTVNFTDSATQPTTAGFNVGATALEGGGYPATTPQHYANSTVQQAGAFALIDGNGDAVAGTITFDIYYDLNVTRGLASAATAYGQTTISLLSSADGGASAAFTDGLLSTDVAGGTGTTSGHFSWTFALAANEAASYTLAGSAIAAAAAVPEPASYALFGLGLAALVPLARRRRAAAKAH